MKKKRVFKLMTAAGCALFAVSAMGAASDVISESFETPDPNTAVTGVTTSGGTWTGYGTVTGATYTAAVAAIGTPINSAAKTKVLAVEGRVTHTLTTATTTQKPATVDMMVQIATPDDALAFPSGTETSDIQIAVGVDTDATLKIWCKNKSGTAAWYSLGSTTYDVGTWHRVSFTFDYAHALCPIRVDGEPMLTANGYLTTDTTVQNDKNGSWYKLAASTTQLTSVQVIGSTSIDELLVRQDTTATSVDTVLPELADKTGDQTIDGQTVPNSWIEQQGITRDTTVAPDGSGMGVGEKYAAGYEVSDGKTFGVKTMSMSGSTATVTFDAAVVDRGYTYKLATSSDNSTWKSEDEVTITAEQAAAGSVSVTLDTAVKYLKLKVVK